MSFPFNVRVYGAFVLDDYILLSEEEYGGRSFTKLPGGGLEYGEGLKDALKREFMEEAGIEIEVLEHLYTTDYFVESAFNPSHQVISVYYRVVLTEPSNSLVHNGSGLLTLVPKLPLQKFTWISLRSLSEESFTFPIDKKLVPLLKSLHSGRQ